jgi:hypothetical protein
MEGSFEFSWMTVVCGQPANSPPHRKVRASYYLSMSEAFRCTKARKVQLQATSPAVAPSVLDMAWLIAAATNPEQAR